MLCFQVVLPFIYYNFVLSRHLIYSLLVSVETLEKNLKQMGRQLQQLEKDLETFPPPEDLHDKFVTKMSISF